MIHANLTFSEISCSIVKQWAICRRPKGCIL